METCVLEYFLRVAQLDSAAESQHITQPTLLQQIEDLEKNMGIKLFDRSNSR